MMLKFGMLRILSFLLLAAMPCCASELVLGDFKTDLVPKPVPYAVLLPDGYKDGPPLPMLMFLHGGSQSRDELIGDRAIFDDGWKSGRLPKMIVATISAGPSCFYMDFKDGSEKWETLITGPFRDFIHTTYHASPDPKLNVLMGGSMGGEGTLRIGMKHPELYAGIAALEPGLEPVLHWSQMQRPMYWWITDEQMHAAFGNPVDPDYWDANNPGLLMLENRERILASGLKILIDVGDEDSLLFTGPVERFHRMLMDAGIRHDYHLVYGADHVGRTLPRRTADAVAFLGRVVRPEGPDPDSEHFRHLLEPYKKKIGASAN